MARGGRSGPPAIPRQISADLLCDAENLGPDMEVEVEVLDMSEDEARTLLMSIDPLAALAETQEQLRKRLGELVPNVPEDLRLAWEATALAAIDKPTDASRWAKTNIPEQFAIIMTCRDEPHQVELLTRLHAEGLDCRARAVVTRGIQANGGSAGKSMKQPLRPSATDAAPFRGLLAVRL